MKQILLAKFDAHNAHVAIIGLGYVGLPLAVAFAEAGYQVTGIDLDARKVDAINRGESYIEDIPSMTLAPLVRRAEAAAVDSLSGKGNMDAVIGAPPLAQGSLQATTDFSVLATVDAVSICVPTPLSKTGDPDISYIVSATEQVARYLHPGMVVVLESTTYPGTTTEIVLSRLQENRQGWRVGEDFFLAFSPERVDPGRTDWTTTQHTQGDRRRHARVSGGGRRLLSSGHPDVGAGLFTRCR